LLAKDNGPSGREMTIEDNSESCDANKIIANPKMRLEIIHLGFMGFG
jgi:hypothetical protein